jgi:1,4-alpha-glucan branching enzyme
LQTLVKELNWFYRREGALNQVDDDYSGFEWIDFRDSEASVISFLRYSRNRDEFVVVCCNFTPVPRRDYRVGLPVGGRYAEIFNTDSEMFGGSNMGNAGTVYAEEISCHGRPASLNVTLPPLAVVMFKVT